MQNSARRTSGLQLAATYYTAHEAELASTFLTNEGVDNEVWDAHLVATDPMLAVAVRGVKVMVPAPALERAKELLSASANPANGASRPIFRVRSNRSVAYGFMGGAAGLLLGGAVAALVGTEAWTQWVIAFVGVGTLAGLVVGGRIRRDTCSDPSCGGVVPVDATHCSKCGGLVRGEIDSINDRLAAEEALEDGDAAEHEEEADEQDEDVDEYGEDADEHDEDADEHHDPKRGA